MTGFSSTLNSGVLVNLGDPDCDAAHKALLKELQRLRVPFLDDSAALTNRQKGNIGEFVTLHVARGLQFGAMEKQAGNALEPLSDISKAGLDLVYVYLDKSNALNDLIYIQEIKTTAQKTLGYWEKLTEDYEKLFATDLDFTLQSRIQTLAFRFEIEQNNDEYAERVKRLGATTPQGCTNVRLLPTGIHDLSVGNPVEKLVAIQSAITVFGWNAAQIAPWAIGLSNLEERLLRLARGKL
ncbi:hypothetical protein HFO39_33040 [Rhizobium leguminosarum]|uniref:hypothetical protein n=1 Tax=Rhizobium leguminosarum TaxID=384 RepID=UPI001C9423E4|nr:hypothetical protein [Rhizobium leguminosarum]MBY5639519.1 hypothetical protein [Rhizobium leguminosarum]